METSDAASSCLAATSDAILSGSMLNWPWNESMATPVNAPLWPTGWPFAESGMLSVRDFACHSR
jgi:hypothetical protein